MSIISATHYTYSSSDGPGTGETRRFGNLTAARLWAASVVPAVVTTNDCYWRDVGRGESVEFTSIRPVKSRGLSFSGRNWARAMSPAGRYEAPVVVVPSVGELGWTP